METIRMSTKCAKMKAPNKWEYLSHFLCVSLSGFYTSNLSILNQSQYLLLKQNVFNGTFKKSESYQCKTVYFLLLFTFYFLSVAVFNTYFICTDHKCSVTLVCTKSIVCLRKDYKENAINALICYGQQCFKRQFCLFSFYFFIANFE